MDKEAVLTRILKPNGTSTLLGGESPARVVNNNKYISPLTCEAQGTDTNVDDTLPSLDDAIHASLSGNIKSVMLVGPAGSGKTTALHKLILDWAKGERLQNFTHVFHFQFSQFHFLDETLSFEELLLHHHGLIPPESVQKLLQKPEDVLFVLDDLDRCRNILDPSVHDDPCSDPGQKASLARLVASLLHGSLLKGAAFVVAAREKDCLASLSGTRVNMCGFLKPQREAYFKGFFTDPDVSEKALVHMERTLGFYDICSSPRFCWTVCSIYQVRMDAGAGLPETLSQLCVEILVHLIKGLSLKKSCSRELVLALGKMASHSFPDQHLSCSKEEMDAFGFQSFLTSAGVFLQVNSAQSDGWVFSFHSQLMREFLLVVSFFLTKSTSCSVEEMLEGHQTEDKMFLDFFLSGLSEPLQRKPLETVLGQLNCDQIAVFKRWFKSNSEIWLKGFDKHMHYRCFHLLHQAQNEMLVKEIVTSSARLGLSYGNLTLQDCSAMSYVVTCLGELEQLNLYRTMNFTEEKAERLAPAICLSQKIMLSDSSLNAGAVQHLATSLHRGLAKELDLSQTHLGDEKLKILCTGLRDCKLQKLKLVVCSLTDGSCEELSSALTSASSQLLFLDLRSNQIGDNGLTKLCKGLRSAHCKLQELQLQGCELTSASMGALSAALSSGQSVLKKVNLTQNTVGDSGVDQLSKALQHPLSNLQSLILFDSDLSEDCCPYLMKALVSDHCRLSELDLSVNELGQGGALLLCQALSRPVCPIEKLSLKRCELTVPVFEELGSVLRRGTSQLKSLLVGLNAVGNQGVKHLLDAVAHPSCLLEELDLEMTGLTDASVEDLCAAIKASQTLKSLELRNNQLTDTSVPALVEVMQDSHNMLEMNLKYNDFSEEALDMLEECSKIRY